MKIVNQTIDIAGKYRYWVELDSGEVVMFKLHKEPKSNQEVYDVANAYVANQTTMKEKEKENRLEEIDQEIKDLQDEKTELESKEK